MRRGTTPTLTFSVPFDPSTLSECYITFKQGDYTFDKVLSDCTTTSTTMAVKLTQAETLGFSDTEMVHIQLRIKYSADGTVDASQIISIPAYEILKGGEI